MSLSSKLHTTNDLVKTDEAGLCQYLRVGKLKLLWGEFFHLFIIQILARNLVKPASPQLDFPALLL